VVGWVALEIGGRLGNRGQETVTQDQGRRQPQNLVPVSCPGFGRSTLWRWGRSEWELSKGREGLRRMGSSANLAVFGSQCTPPNRARFVTGDRSLPFLR